MCTVIAIKGRHPRYPLIVAANRDELYARPTAPPRLVHRAPRALAGVDLQAGGSWMGANERGLFVAITNQRTHEPPEPGRASRGEIVMEALAQPDVAGVDALLGSLDARDYNAFNVLYGDAGTLKLGYARGGAPEVTIEDLPDGLWVLPNDRIGSPEFPKTERATALAEPLIEQPWEALHPALARVLADHEKPPMERVPAPPPGSRFDHRVLRELQALCIHTPVYGTRSATILALEPGRVAHYLAADGPPCTAPFQPLTALLQ